MTGPCIWQQFSRSTHRGSRVLEQRAQRPTIAADRSQPGKPARREAIRSRADPCDAQRRRVPAPTRGISCREHHGRRPVRHAWRIGSVIWTGSSSSLGFSMGTPTAGPKTPAVVPSPAPMSPPKSPCPNIERNLTHVSTGLYELNWPWKPHCCGTRGPVSMGPLHGQRSTLSTNQRDHIGAARKPRGWTQIPANSVGSLNWRSSVGVARSARRWSYSRCWSLRNSAARSPIITQGAMVLALVIRGMIEPSATRRFSIP